MKTRLALLLFALAGSIVSYTQVQIDPRVEIKYREAIKKVPEEFLKAFTVKDDSLSSDPRDAFFFRNISFGIFTLYKTDTLNKKDVITHTGSVSVEAYDPVTGKSSPMQDPKYEYSDGENTYLPVISFAILENDTVKVRMPFLFEPLIEWNIARNGITAFFKDYRKNDFIFRTGINQPKTSAISLPVQVLRFTVSDTSLTAGKVIYGEAEMKTPAYYEDDSFSFTTGYIQKQLHVAFVFELHIRTRDDLNRKQPL